NLSLQHSVFNSFIAEIRDENVQKDSMRFRYNMERIAEILGYELSKKMNTKTIEVQTPLGISKEHVLAEAPVLATILRAGLAMHNGLLRMFDNSDSAFISAFRKHTTPEEFEIYVEYLAAPLLDGRVWIISDPMLATGSSMVTVYKALLKSGKPSKVYIVSAIATPDAIDLIKRTLPENTEIWVGAIDVELTAQSYIVPGLGDAGDLAFGIKV
ncbi:MAG: uracil phosphoribosyltransferase, partial [Crocinitomicaceae bacterium]|nr:uracil phosphoribosyltransferase [Crocinitomicaceae bacterium]